MQSVVGRDWVNQLIPTHARTRYPTTTGFTLPALFSWIGAHRGSRTLTPFRAPVPQTGLSTIPTCAHGKVIWSCRQPFVPSMLPNDSRFLCTSISEVSLRATFALTSFHSMCTLPNYFVEHVGLEPTTPCVQGRCSCHLS